MCYPLPVMKNILHLICVSALSAILYTGCGQRAERTPGELIVALQADAATLDPHAAADAAAMRMLENVYSALYRHSSVYGEIEPDLVHDTEISEDGLVYTFHLREDVRFHSGRPLDADDVVWSLNRIREEGMRADQLDAIDEIEAADAHTVRVTLHRPHAPLRTALAHPMSAILDREALEDADNRFDRAQAGSGPFRLVEWRRGRHLILEANDAYYEEGLPKLNRIIFRPVSDATAANTALRNGEIDLILDLNPREISRLQEVEGITVRTKPGTFWEYIGLNTRVPPLDDPRVRQAIAHAIDRDALAEMVKFGHATPLTGGHIPDIHPAHTDLELYPARDLATARTLLAEAGFGDGLHLTCIVGSEFDYQVQAAQVIKQQLLDVGIDVTVNALESGIFFNRLGDKDFEMSVVGWLGFVDADEWTRDLFHTRGAYNQQQYSNPEVDSLLDRAREEADFDTRMALYREAQEMIAQEAPMVFLYINDLAAAHTDALRDFELHPTLTTLSLRKARLERGMAE